MEKEVKLLFSGGPDEVKFRDTTQIRFSIWKHRVQSICHSRVKNVCEFSMRRIRLQPKKEPNAWSQKQ